MDAVNSYRGIECQHEAEKPEQHSCVESQGAPALLLARCSVTRRRLKTMAEPIAEDVVLAARASDAQKIFGREPAYQRVEESPRRPFHFAIQHGLRTRRNHEPRPACKKAKTADGRNCSEPPNICQRHHI